MKLKAFATIFAGALIIFGTISTQPSEKSKQPSVTLPSIAIGVAVGVLLKSTNAINIFLSIDPEEDNNPLLNKKDQNFRYAPHIVNGVCILSAVCTTYLSSYILRYFAERSHKKAAPSKPSLDEHLPR